MLNDRSLRIKVKYFALYEELKNKKEEEYKFSEPTTIKTVFFKLMDDIPLKEHYFKATLFALNQQYVSSDTVIKDGDEVAFIPPVAGG